MLLTTKKYYLKLFFTLILAFSISACSPHPGAGNWQAEGKNSINVSQIKVLYEGTADFYTTGEKESIRRCFWSAVTENTLQMQCVYANNIDKKVNYQFVVSPKGHAKLFLDEQIIGNFITLTNESDIEN